MEYGITVDDDVQAVRNGGYFSDQGIDAGSDSEIRTDMQGRDSAYFYVCGYVILVICLMNDRNGGVAMPLNTEMSLRR